MVYVFLANGFEEMEALAPVDLLRRAGVEVFTVGVGSDMIVSSHNIPVKTDTTVDKIVLKDELEMIVLPDLWLLTVSSSLQRAQAAA